MGFSSILSIALVLAPGSEAFLSARGAMPLASSRVVASPAAFRSTSLAPRQQCYTKSLKMSTAAAPVVAGGSTAAPVPSAASAPSVKPPPQMYQNAVDIGQKKASGSAAKLFLMGIISGCHIGFGALLAVSIGGNCPGLLATNPGLQKIIFGAFGLPFGLFMTVVGGGELFTGNTAVVTAAVIEGKASIGGLLKNWVFSYLGNFVGSLLLVFLAVQGGVVVNPGSAMGIATAKTSLTFVQAFARGILCNWLVCMAVWMSVSASDAAGKFFAIFLPISAFVALGLDHSVANMFLIPLGMALGAGVTWSQFLLANLLPVTLGNIVGGAVAVCGLYSGAFGSLFGKKK
ncbi:unnamed protein product [Ectocarpus sp. 6 AP-2014]